MDNQVIDPDLLNDFIAESLDSLESLDTLFVKLEKSPNNQEIINSIFRPIHSLKGNSAYFGLMRVKELSHAMENILDDLRKGRKKVTKSVINVLLPGADMLRNMLQSVRKGGEECKNSKKFSSILEDLLKTPLEEEIVEKKEEDSPTEIVQQEESHAKSMRISEASLDSFFASVGDLVVVEEMFDYLIKKVRNTDSDGDITKQLRQIVDTFKTTSASLRDGVLQIRKVEADILLRKVPRLIRDIADRLGKMVDVVCLGQNVRIDKSYAELLGAPLTHMVRNAIDHGIEMPNVRKLKGKPERGTISVSITDEGGSVVLTVSDDGGGLNYKAIAKKAMELGLLEPDMEISEAIAVDMLFRSGVSTAESITDVSGRGVGMDVVKREIESVGGSISVTSTIDKGTTFTLSLPSTVRTKITDGYLIKSNHGETYALPMKNVLEAFTTDSDKIITVTGNRGEAVKLRDSILPVIRLDNVLHSSHKEVSDNSINDRILMLHIKTAQNSFALVVKEVTGVQKVVVKPVEGFSVEEDIFDGAAMMGDGGVLMIIGERGLDKMACSSS